MWKNARSALILFLFALLTAFALPHAAQAAGLKNLRTPYTHTSHQEPLTALLSNFAISQGYSAAFTSRVEGTVSGEFSALPPLAFLASMRAGYGVEAYILGSTIYFFHQSERRREILRINSMRPSDMRQALLRMGILSHDLPSSTSNRDRLLFIEGPEAYVAGLIASIRALEDMQMQELSIRVFPLKHAWADDTKVEGATGTTTIPGVASVLRAIATGKPSPTVHTVHRSDGASSLLGSGIVGRREAEAAPAQQAAAPGPNIIAESRTNSLIVTDRQSRMPYYEAVIAELDRPLDLVEIHAAIVDINADYSFDLGINWGGRIGRGRFAGSTGTMGGPGQPALSPGAPQPGGLALSTVYTSGLNQFFSNIHALERRGEGAVLSRPSVLTVDNVQASLEYTTTFYIRLTGERAVDLVPVTSGTTLKVTPRILRAPDGAPSRLAMSIVISDGADPLASSPDSWVDNLPPVKKVTINTQAVVAAGQSLILGGFYYEQRGDNRSGVPGLMNVPVAGSLFSRTGENVRRMERLIIISPRIITYDALDAPLPERVEEQRFALSPTAENYELREDFYNLTPRRGAGCSPGVVRPVPTSAPARGSSP